MVFPQLGIRHESRWGAIGSLVPTAVRWSVVKGVVLLS